MDKTCRLVPRVKPHFNKSQINAYHAFSYAIDFYMQQFIDKLCELLFFAVLIFQCLVFFFIDITFCRKGFCFTLIKIIIFICSGLCLLLYLYHRPWNIVLFWKLCNFIFIAKILLKKCFRLVSQLIYSLGYCISVTLYPFSFLQPTSIRIWSSDILIFFHWIFLIFNAEKLWTLYVYVYKYWLCIWRIPQRVCVLVLWKKSRVCVSFCVVCLCLVSVLLRNLSHVVS